MAELKRKRLQLDERRTQILDLGLKFFSERSYDDVNLDEVAKSAGISKGLLFHYFSTKRAFYTATIQIAAKQLLARTEVKRNASPLESLQDGLDAYLQYVKDHAKAYVTLLRSGVGSDPKIAKIVEKTRATMAERILEGLGERKATTEQIYLVRGWIGFVETTSLDWLEKGGIDPKNLRNLWIRVLMNSAPEPKI